MTKRKPKEEHKPDGAPTKYKESHNDEAYKLCLLGYTDVQLADYFEVTEKTINNWKSEHPTFLQSLRLGKEIADAEIAESLFKRGKGFTKEAIKPMLVAGNVVDHPVVEYYPPDVKAAQIWLYNRQRHNWKQKQTVTLDNQIEDVGFEPPEKIEKEEGER